MFPKKPVIKQNNSPPQPPPPLPPPRPIGPKRCSLCALKKK
jgi:hypothetical protein